MCVNGVRSLWILVGWMDWMKERRKKGWKSQVFPCSQRASESRVRIFSAFFTPRPFFIFLFSLWVKKTNIYPCCPPSPFFPFFSLFLLLLFPFLLSFLHHHHLSLDHILIYSYTHIPSSTSTSSFSLHSSLPFLTPNPLF